MFESKKWHDKLPDVNEELNEGYLRLFFETLYERQLIWKKRFIDNKERPWTDDEILRDNKFTNVYRELDRSSQWEIKNILMDKGLNLENLVWKILVYRTFNNPQTFEAGIKVGYRNGIPNYEDYDKQEFYCFIEAVRKEIQIQMSKLFDYRYWKYGNKVEWDDMLQVVKQVDGVRYVPDTHFYPQSDINVPKYKLPRLRAFIMRDLDGNIIEDNNGVMSDVFYPSEMDDAFIGSVLRAI